MYGGRDCGGYYAGFWRNGVENLRHLFSGFFYNARLRGSQRYYQASA
jgi:hypothetical protein